VRLILWSDPVPCRGSKRRPYCSGGVGPCQGFIAPSGNNETPTQCRESPLPRPPDPATDRLDPDSPGDHGNRCPGIERTARAAGSSPQNDVARDDHGTFGTTPSRNRERSRCTRNAQADRLAERGDYDKIAKIVHAFTVVEPEQPPAVVAPDRQVRACPSACG
jgi:hypothetical protein